MSDEKKPPESQALDAYVIGVAKNNGPIIIAGKWTPQGVVDEVLKKYATPKIRLRYGYSRYLFGIEWWNEMVEFDATISMSTPFSLSIQRLGAVEVKRAEWWRRLGYCFVRFLPEPKKGKGFSEKDFGIGMSNNSGAFVDLSKEFGNHYPPQTGGYVQLHPGTDHSTGGYGTGSDPD